MQELLEHKWVRSPEAKLRARELEGTKEKIKEFNAKRKLKAGGNTCSQNSVPTLVLLTAVQYKYEPDLHFPHAEPIRQHEPQSMNLNTKYTRMHLNRLEPQT